MGRMILAAVLMFAGAAQAAPTHITFVTDWKAQAEHGGFYEAQALGLYAKRAASTCASSKAARA